MSDKSFEMLIGGSGGSVGGDGTFGDDELDEGMPEEAISALAADLKTALRDEADSLPRVLKSLLRMARS